MPENADIKHFAKFTTRNCLTTFARNDTVWNVPEHLDPW